MVQYSPTQTFAHRRFRVERPLTGEAGTIHRRMESAGTYVQLVDEVRGQGDGRSPRVGSVIFGYLIMTTCTKHLCLDLCGRDAYHTHFPRRGLRCRRKSIKGADVADGMGFDG